MVPIGSRIRDQLGRVSSFAILDELLADLDPTEPFPASELGKPRGRQGSPKKVALPDGWLLDREMAGRLDPSAELAISGG